MVSKNVKGEPLGIFNILTVATYKKNEGGFFRDIENISKKTSVPKKAKLKTLR